MVASQLIQACASAGGGSASGLTVLEATVQKYGSYDPDPESPRFLIRVGSMEANGNWGLIFRVRGVCPGDDRNNPHPNFRLADEFPISSVDELTWEPTQF